MFSFQRSQSVTDAPLADPQRSFLAIASCNRCSCDDRNSSQSTDVLDAAVEPSRFVMDGPPISMESSPLPENSPTMADPSAVAQNDEAKAAENLDAQQEKQQVLQEHPSPNSTSSPKEADKEVVDSRQHYNQTREQQLLLEDKPNAMAEKQGKATLRQQPKKVTKAPNSPKSVTEDEGEPCHLDFATAGMPHWGSSRGDSINPWGSSRGSPGKRQHHKKQHFALSKSLSSQLGIEGVESATNQFMGGMSIVAKVRGRLQSFRNTMTAVNAPDEKAFQRGVHIHDVYDFSTFEDRKIRVRKMNESVFHHRAGLADDRSWEPSSSSSSSEKDSDEDSPRENDDLPRRHRSGKRSGGKTSESPRLDTQKVRIQKSKNKEENKPAKRKSAMRLTRMDTVTNQECLTHWGVLTGKLLKARVLDFTTASGKLVHRQKFQGSTAKSGVMFMNVRARARAVVGQAWKVAKRISHEKNDVFDSDWAERDLLVHLFSKEYMDTLALFAHTARKVLAVQPSLVEVEAPCRVFGDIHGQLRDLLLLFRIYGYPDDEDAPVFVFNGDFVDRGKHQLEVIGVLLALKILLPEQVWLIRGNHEDRDMNQRYGFADECRRKLGRDHGPTCFEFMQKAFDQLPLACLISDRALVVHGGIGDGAFQVDDIRHIKRPIGNDKLAEPEHHWIYNMLWSDPIEDDDKKGAVVFGVHQSPRGGLCARFGWNVTKMFCARNGLSLIIRSHQSKKGSIGFDIMHENLMIRVFSARDYEGHRNDSAVLLLQPDEDGGLLTVRPQVLRSAAKAEEEVARRKSEKLEMRDGI